MHRIDLAVLTFLILAVPEFGGAAEPQRVQFNRDVRSILSDYCFQCHGPDKNQRKAELRLDTREGLFRKTDNGRVVVPGKPVASELYRRITSHDSNVRMPPPEAGRNLSQRQIETLKRWISQGAEWQKHWAFIPPVPNEPPAPTNDAERRWIRNAIDAFVLARLKREGLEPSPEADRETLIRRVTLDLTGLPPTPAEVDAFLADDRPNAYERLVDSLLASPRYGEQMAVRWLDAARYADTSGYQSDGVRDMWRWRDWVIEAYNADKPFDEFTIEQLAGDMLPRATLDQRIATGFNRNHRGNAEGGVIPEEYAVEYVVDRVDTTFTVWLGLTMGCARCHDHKFDPLTQKEFYRVFAYFNNVPEHGRALKDGNSPPWIKAPTREQQRRLKQLDHRLASAESRFREIQPELTRAQASWERVLKVADRTTAEPDWTITAGQVAHFALDRKPFAGPLIAPRPGTTRRDTLPRLVSGRRYQAAEFDGKRFITAGDVGNFGYFDKFSLAAWVYPHAPPDSRRPYDGTIVSRMVDLPKDNGYYVQLVDGRVQVNLVKRWLDDSIRVETKRRIDASRWHHIAVVYDGRRTAEAIQIYIDGQREPIHANLDYINQTFEVDEPLRIGAGNGPGGRFRGRIDDVRIYNRALTANDAAILSVAETIEAILDIPAPRRSALQQLKLRRYFLEHRAPQKFKTAWVRLTDLRKQRARFYASIPTVMVMQEMSEPRPTFVLERGQYDKPGERVAPGLPKSLPGLPGAFPNNRLGFARWLVDPSHPMTARVAVNRYWEMHFGRGLVSTMEDFGVQGRPPTHPDLLDWLAVEFRKSRVSRAESREPARRRANGSTLKQLCWNVKRLHRLIVTSATYRQSSRVSPDLLQRDPNNRLLARGPRFRLTAEMIRDQALFAAGLLTERLGGPSVKPYQPLGLWKEIASAGEYRRDRGAKLYRRSMYTFWKRTVAPPTMTALDAGNREACQVKRPRTNTPLQALALLNDVTFVEAARKLAERALQSAGPQAEDRIERLFRMMLARRPDRTEAAILTSGYRRHLAVYRADAKAARNLLQTGDSPADASLDPAELAAATAVAATILNLDEAITRE